MQKQKLEGLSQYKRFYAFGCSYTNYRWPTWADIIGQQMPYYENWGKLAAGNQFIFNSVVECNQSNGFNKDDLIIVMWSSIHREDRYVNNYWETTAFEQLESVYGVQWMRKYGIETRGNLIRDLAYIKSIQYLLDSTGCDYVFLNGVFLTVPKGADPGQVDLANATDVIEMYRDVLDSIKPSLWVETDHNKRPNFNDRHPSPMESANYIKKYIDIDLHGEFVEYWERQVRAIKEKNVLPVPWIRNTSIRL